MPENGLAMIGTCFQAVGVENEISVQDIKAKGLTGVDWTFATEAGDTLSVWSSADQGYLTTLYYTGDEASEAMANNGAEPGQWFDMEAYAASDLVLKPGDAFWIESTSASATVTQAGEVPTDAPVISIVPGLNMIANPYPKAVAVNDLFTATGLTGVDWTFQTEAGDTLAIWDPEEQAYLVTLYYTGDTASQAMTDNGAEPSTWFDMESYATAETVIPVGGAFWIQSSGEGTITFK